MWTHIPSASYKIISLKLNYLPLVDNVTYEYVAVLMMESNIEC